MSCDTQYMERRNNVFFNNFLNYLHSSNQFIAWQCSYVIWNLLFWWVLMFFFYQNERGASVSIDPCVSTDEWLIRVYLFGCHPWFFVYWLPNCLPSSPQDLVTHFMKNPKFAFCFYESHAFEFSFHIWSVITDRMYGFYISDGRVLLWFCFYLTVKSCWEQFKRLSKCWGIESYLVTFRSGIHFMWNPSTRKWSQSRRISAFFKNNSNPQPDYKPVLLDVIWCFAD